MLKLTPKLLLVSVVFLGFSGLVLAHSGASGVVKERMDLMGDVAKAMKSIGQMIAGKTTYDASVVEQSARSISMKAVHMIKLFPEGSLDKPTEALPSVWENWAEFEKIARDMQRSADSLAEVAVTATEVDAIKQPFSMLGRSCADCHEKFRLKK